MNMIEEINHILYKKNFEIWKIIFFHYLSETYLWLNLISTIIQKYYFLLLIYHFWNNNIQEKFHIIIFRLILYFNWIIEINLIISLNDENNESQTIKKMEQYISHNCSSKIILFLVPISIKNFISYNTNK